MGCMLLCCCCCINDMTAKALEITLLVLHGIAFFLLFLCLVIIKWSRLYTANILFFLLMFFIEIACIIFLIFLRYWRAYGRIKADKKYSGMVLCSVGIGITITNLVVALVEMIILLVNFTDLDFPCYSLVNDKSTYTYYYYRALDSLYTRETCKVLGKNYDAKIISSGEYSISIITFCYCLLAFFLLNFMWYVLRRRILLGINEPEHIVPPVSPALGPQIIPGPQMVDPYGRVVIIAQSYNVSPYTNNMPFPRPNNNINEQVEPRIPGSNDEVLSEKM